MAAVNTWNRIVRWLRRARKLPARVEAELETLEQIHAQVAALTQSPLADPGAFAQIQQQTDHELAVQKAQLQQHIDQQLAAQSAQLQQLAVQTAQLQQHIEQQLAVQAAQVQQYLEHLRAELAERTLLVEAAVRDPQRAAAEAAVRRRYPPMDTRTPGMSVLIPCWNHSRFLDRAVTSALNTLDAIEDAGEVIILDDASRDETRQSAQRAVHTDSRVRLLTTDQNVGLPRARNLLLSQAKHHHSMMLDADNELVPSGVAILYEAALHTGATLTYGNLVVFDEADRALGVFGNERVSAALAEQNWIDAMALVKTERLLTLGGYTCENVSGLEDWELNMRLACLGEPLCFVPTLMGRYRRSDLSMVHDALSLTVRARRIRRMFAMDGMLDAKVRACVYHPITGYLWRSPQWKGRSAEASAPPPSPHPARRALRVLVVSSAGVRNHGDDAILLSTLHRLERLRRDCVPVVVTDGEAVPSLGRRGIWAGTLDELCRSWDPDLIRRGCHGHPELADKLPQLVGAMGQSVPGIPSELTDFDLILLCGGGNLASYWPELVARRAAVAAAARAQQVPCVISGQGIGPLNDEITPMLRLLFSRTGPVATRDRLSANLLKEQGIDGDRVCALADDALGLPCPPPHIVRKQLEQAGVPPNTPLLAFHAREAPYVGASPEELLNTARLVDEMAARGGYAVVCVPINTQPWAPEAELLRFLADAISPRRAQWYIVDCGADVASVAGVIAQCKAVVCHSYHIALFALQRRIPTLLKAHTEYYMRKATGLQQVFGVPEEMTIPRQASAEMLLAQLHRMAERKWTPHVTAGDLDHWLDQALTTATSEKETHYDPTVSKVA